MSIDAIHLHIRKLVLERTVTLDDATGKLF